MDQIPLSPLIFVGGKGGVGKTTVSKALAHALSQKGKKVLWAEFENPLHDRNHLVKTSNNHHMLNCDATHCFEEYIQLKIGIPGLSHFFVKNRLIRYLAEAAPGIHEMVLLGKVWHDSKKYDHVVADLPATGHGLAMFHSVKNFSKLFRTGPIHRDAEDMLRSFNDPRQCSHLVVSLPEEMPIRESIELKKYIDDLFAQNPSHILVNKCFPDLAEFASQIASTHKHSPLALNSKDYVIHRSLLEKKNLTIYNDSNTDFFSIPYLTHAPIHEKMAEEISAQGYV